MSRVHDVWVTVNRPRRRGTWWIEAIAYVACFAAWFVVVIFFVSLPGSDSFFWILVPFSVWQLWTIWFRNHRPDEPLPVPQWETSRMTGALPPGMVYPSDWQGVWLQEQRERRRSRGYFVLSRTMWVVAGAIALVGVYVGHWQIVAVAFFVAALLGFDWWRYVPHDRDRP